MMCVEVFLSLTTDLSDFDLIDAKSSVRTLRTSGNINLRQEDRNPLLASPWDTAASLPQTPAVILRLFYIRRQRCVWLNYTYFLGARKFIENIVAFHACCCWAEAGWWWAWHQRWQRSEKTAKRFFFLSFFDTKACVWTDAVIPLTTFLVCSYVAPSSSPIAECVFSNQTPRDLYWKMDPTKEQKIKKNTDWQPQHFSQP